MGRGGEAEGIAAVTLIKHDMSQEAELEPMGQSGSPSKGEGGEHNEKQ